MCFLITAYAAIIASILWFAYPQAKLNFAPLSLILSGATLMWFVDCCVSYIEGEGFLDISIDDTILGFVVLLCALILWFCLNIYAHLKTKIA